jgi:polar amino acid transport system substrate-binding protein
MHFGAVIGSGLFSTGAFMRLALEALLVISLSVTGAEAPLRFVVPDSWAMPITRPPDPGHPA